VSALELVIKFLIFTIYEHTKDKHLLVHISDLNELRTRILENRLENFTERELEKYFRPVVNNIIGWNPAIENQLYMFWNACMEVTHLSNLQKRKFTLFNTEKRLIDNILAVQNMRNNIFKDIKNTNDKEIPLYALFYLHILQTETLEFALVGHFSDLLKSFNLDKQYDIHTIFSVTYKIQRNKDFVTDSRAIRDALSHLKYRIIEENDTWRIHFKNTDYGYDFDKTFTFSDLIRYFTNVGFLYESQMALIWTIAAMADANACQPT
jgi:hypothetical protein